MEETLLENNCRVCLCSIVGTEAHDLFEKDDGYENIGEKLEICCHIKLKQLKTMPRKICTKCNVILNMSFNFAKMCRTSQDYLESLYPTQLQLQSPQDALSSTNHVYDENPIQEMKQTIKMRDSDENSFENIEFYDETIESDDEKKLFRQYIDEVTADGDDEQEFMSEVLIKPRQRKQTTIMCSICGNIYNNKATFNYHMSCHLDQKNFECEICHKKFRQSSVLTNHMRTHTGERPFKCNYCKRDFADKSSRQRHERIHTNERPYKCEICDKTFTYSGILKKHRRTHTGEKPHHCNVCMKSFAEPHQLKAHLETILHRQREAKLNGEASDDT